MERGVRMPGPRRGFDPVRVVKINPQLIDGVLADNRQILLAGLPRHLMLLKQREKLRRPDAVHQRVEEHAVVEQIVDPAARRSWGRVSVGRSPPD